jgi:spore germination cell wall hydrolase CwlJ-like protein
MAPVAVGRFLPMRPHQVVPPLNLLLTIGTAALRPVKSFGVRALRLRGEVSARVVSALSALLILSNCAAQTSAPEVPESAMPTRASADDLSCLAEAVYFEARGTGQTGTEAVAHVVVNRARSPKFPNSICGVVGDECQFSYRCDGRPDYLAHATDRTQALRIAQRVLAGAPDITSGALFFHAAWMEPGWFGTRPRVGQFGGNVFYR